ncbi:MAG TPA: HAMP domain-containing sensor histidine kinase, partial [Polyangiales bacterium]|nr:HAMP domain-containing sensor histidine kinase [Polyangiales bacterium]
VLRAYQREIVERWSATSDVEARDDLPALLEALASSIEGAAQVPACERFGIAEYRKLRSAILAIAGEASPSAPISELAKLDAELDRLIEAAGERRAAEQQTEVSALYAEAQQAIRVRDEFLSIASHELRTPLASLDLALQNLERRIREVAPDEAALEWIGARLATAARQGQRLQRLADELLDVSRIVGERLHLDLELVSLTGVVQEVLVDLEEQGVVQRSKCTIGFQPRGEAIGRWDRHRLHQIVTKLVENALKFGAGAPVEISVGDHDACAELIVRDHGIGIATADRQRIFTRFERAVAERHYGGFGLGLWIVRQIVEAMHGSVQVESELGQGSTFTVRLPKEPEPTSHAEAHDQGANVRIA